MEASLVAVREAAESVIRVTAPERRALAVGPLRGLYYAFKSERLAERFSEPLRAWVVEGILAPDGVPTGTAANAGDMEAWLLEAVLRSVHSTGDLLAQSANQVTLAKPLVLDDCNRPSVIQKLRSESARRREPALDEVARALDAYASSPEYLYLEAFVNVCKHQSFVERSHHSQIDSDGELTTRVTLQGFTYRGCSWPPRSSRELAEATESLRDQAMATLAVMASAPWHAG